MARFRLNSRGDLVPADGPRRDTRARHLDPGRQFRSTAAWQRARAAQIKREPWCAACGHEGSTDNPLTADHIVPVAEGGVRLDGTNLRTLCRRCNSSRGARR
jgi:5-methylcytosine-specific restriction endonuclease McrA